MSNIYDILNINQETLKDFHLQAKRIDDYQTNKIINQNLKKMKEIESRAFANENIKVSKQSIDEILYKVIEKSRRKDLNMENWSVRELRIVSYYLMKLQDDDSVYNFALSLLDRKWQNIFFNGLVFYVMNSWNLIRPQIRRNTCELIHKKLSTYRDTNRRYLMYKNHADFFDDAGPARMAALLLSKKQDVLTAPSMLGNTLQSFAQSYYSDVIIKFIEKVKLDLNQLEKIFQIHQDARTKKLVLANMVIDIDKLHDPIKESEISHFINRILGDITITSTWAPFPGASNDDALKLKKAMNLSKLWFAKRIIETFFDICVQDRERKEFWLQYVKYVSGFKIVGSALTRQSLQNDPRTSGMFLSHFIVTNSKTSQTSALVLSIKNKVIVEFSDTGALYVYNQNNNKVRFLRTGAKTMASINDLKSPSMCMLVEPNYWGDYNIFNEQGRLTHQGYWRTRLDNWIYARLLNESNTELSFFETKDDEIFVARGFPKEGVIKSPANSIKTSTGGTMYRTKVEGTNINNANKVAQTTGFQNTVQYEKRIRCNIVGNWLFNNSCRIVCNNNGYYLQVSGNDRFAHLRELDGNLSPVGNICYRSSEIKEWYQIIHLCNGKEYNVGYIKKGLYGVFLFKRELNQSNFITIKPSENASKKYN